jgi:ubiquinone/menaquinone biosynthesis C-methylase UbiE
VTLLYFTLHHCADPRQVLQEARRVSKRGVIVVESTYSTSWQHRLLHAVDVWANRWRSGGQMTWQEEQLCFQRPREWRTLIQELGGHVQAEQRFGSPIHEQVLFIIK